MASDTIILIAMGLGLVVLTALMILLRIEFDRYYATRARRMIAAPYSDPRQQAQYNWLWVAYEFDEIWAPTQRNGNGRSAEDAVAIDR